MTPTEATLAWMRSRADMSLSNLNGSGARLGTWLVVGNVAALVLIMKVVADGSGCNANILATAAQKFAFGLAIAFVGWVVGYVTSIVGQLLTESAITATATLVTNGDYVDRLEAEYGENYQPGGLEDGIDAAGKQLEKLEGRIKWLVLGSVLSAVLFGVSAVLFIQGALLPLNSNTIASCLAGPATSVTTGL